METISTFFTETKGFLEKVSCLNYPDKEMFIALLFRDEAGADSLLDMYDILEKLYPDWVNAFVNSSDFETGRMMAIEDAIGTYLTIGEF